MKPKIILASASERRKDLLKEAGFRIEVLPSRIAEKTHLKKPSALVQLNAILKAKAIARRKKKGIVLGADTLIYFRQKIIGKPKNKKEALRFLNRLQGETHFVYTGVCLIDAAREKQFTFFDKTKVCFKKLSPAVIRKYHSLMNPLDKAGAYAINEYGEMILKKLEGSFSNVVGLPMEKLKKVLKKEFSV